ncbi:hypothetical protein Tco_0047546 [Tanacetum coccineum]
MSLLTPLIHHPPRCKHDSNHFVSLTSTTYGSLNGYLNGSTHENNLKNHVHQDVSSPDSNFVINTWDLMDGLDDDLDGFDIIEFSDAKDTKPLWKHLFEETLLSKMDSNLVNSYNKGLDSKMVSKVVVRKNAEQINRKRVVIDIVVKIELCCRVFIDERDISMDSSYRKELQSVFGGNGFSLPQVFISEGAYWGCGDAQFVPYPNYSGSRKVFEEDERRSIRYPNYNKDGVISSIICAIGIYVVKLNNLQVIRRLY